MGILYGGSLGGVLHLQGRLPSMESRYLAWILLPTTRLVELYTGLDFVFDPLKGFVNYGAGVVIGSSCSGLTFLSIAFVMALFSFLHRFRSPVRALAAFALSAYVLTLLANASRVAGALLALRLHDRWNMPGRGHVHMAVGIACYGTFLVVYYLLLQKVAERRPS